MAKPSWFQRAVLGVGATPLTGVKQFTEPPFWESDLLRSPWLSTSSLLNDREAIVEDFEGFIAGALKANGVVFACVVTRLLVFTEARFQWREFRNGRPGDLFGSAELALLENPWPSGTTGELLARAEQDAFFAGNFYATTVDDRGRYGNASVGGAGRRITRMRPDWVTIVIQSPSGNPNALDARVVGYEYRTPPSGGVAVEPVLLLPGEVCHYSPLPDPTARYRGMSWLSPIIRNVEADKAATAHKAAFFANGATPGLAAVLPATVGPAEFEAFVAKFDAAHKGASNAYKTMFLGGGADVTVVGSDFQQLDLKATQGADETRICMAARVPPSIVGASEGLAGSSLNAGNFSAARRMFVDGTMRPLWRMFAASAAPLVTSPRAGAALWYDARDIAFLREDAKDAAEIQRVEAETITILIREGFDPDVAVNAVTGGDLRRLQGSHNGLPSVQQQQALASAQRAVTPDGSNGNGNGRVPAGLAG